MHNSKREKHAGKSQHIPCILIISSKLKRLPLTANCLLLSCSFSLSFSLSHLPSPPTGRPETIPGSLWPHPVVCGLLPHALYYHERSNEDLSMAACGEGESERSREVRRGKVSPLTQAGGLTGVRRGRKQTRAAASSGSCATTINSGALVGERGLPSVHKMRSQ